MSVTPEKKSPTSVGENLLALWESFIGVVVDIFSLTALEAKIARTSLIKMLGCFLVMTLFMTTAWIFLMLALGFYFFLLGVNLPLCLLGAVVLNIFLVFFVLGRIKIHRHNLSFPATRRQLHTAFKSSSKTQGVHSNE